MVDNIGDQEITVNPYADFDDGYLMTRPNDPGARAELERRGVEIPEPPPPPTKDEAAEALVEGIIDYKGAKKELLDFVLELHKRPAVLPDGSFSKEQIDDFRASHTTFAIDVETPPKPGVLSGKEYLIKTCVDPDTGGDQIVVVSDSIEWHSEAWMRKERKTWTIGDSSASLVIEAPFRKDNSPGAKAEWIWRRRELRDESLDVKGVKDLARELIDAKPKKGRLWPSEAPGVSVK